VCEREREREREREMESSECHCKVIKICTNCTMHDNKNATV
jgi:hypothetical protein